MTVLAIPNSVSIHSLRNFLATNKAMFAAGESDATINFYPTLSHLDPLALAMIASWGHWCRRQGKKITINNLSHHCDYAARMRLFEHLGHMYKTSAMAHEEAGRFIPILQVNGRDQISKVIADMSALLHMENERNELAAVQYCVSELLRNVLEHSQSEDGAFVCAHRYQSTTKRVTIAVADCGMGITRHLARAIPTLEGRDREALGMAMRPGVTGAIPGLYGTPDNAGAGLFITRCIAKGTGGYFAIVSGQSAYRLRRSNSQEAMQNLPPDPFDEENHDLWEGLGHWNGTAVSLEIRTDMIGDFSGLFEWIKKRIPSRASTPRKIRFS